ncbi:MAG: hypothetical protein R2712_27080 [Vicinamibacterales bacterium]
MSRLHWVTNGTVRAVAAQDQAVYIGGSFTRVAPAANFLGPWFGVSTTTGAPLPRMALADGPVFAIEPDGAGGYYVGGRFQRIGGVARTSLAHVLADGSVDPAFVPDLRAPAFDSHGRLPGAEVRSLARFGTTLFAGGSIQTTLRFGLVALDAASGAPTAFPVAAPPGFEAERMFLNGGHLVVFGSDASGIHPTVLSVDPASGGVAWSRPMGLGGVRDGVLAGGRLIVAGSFRSSIPSGPSSLASLDPATGAIDLSWTPTQVDPTTFASADVWAVTAIGSTVYVGGRFAAFGGQPRANAAAVDLATGIVTGWAPAIDGIVRDMAPSAGASLYIAGGFQTVGGVTREGLAEIDVAGVVSAWTAQAYSTDVWTFHATGNTLIAGGSAAVAGGMPRTNLAAFDLAADDVLSWAPVVNESVARIAVDGPVVLAELDRPTPSQSNPTPRVAAFDAASGAPAWALPDFTLNLLGAFDGYGYVSQGLWIDALLLRVDLLTGTVDPSWRFAHAPSLLLRKATTGYFFGYLTRFGDAGAVDLVSGTVGPWMPGYNELFPFTFPEGSPSITAAALMGRTMYLHYTWTSLLSSSFMSAVDLESGRGVTSIRPPHVVSSMGAADGLLVTAGRIPYSMLFPPPPVPFLTATRPDGTPSAWNPGMAPTEVDQPVDPRIVVTGTDIVVSGVQLADDAAPVHGVAVFARQPSEAPATLEATTLDNLVTLSWAAAQPGVVSHVLEVGSTPGGSNVLVQDTGGSLPALQALAPAGTYFVRVRAAGAVAGTPAAAPTNEIAVRVGCTAPPPAPTRLAAAVTGLHVSLTWEPPPFAAVTRYVIEAGAGPGLANLARIGVPGSQSGFEVDAPPATYYVRVRSENACGASAASPDIWMTVGGAALPAAPEVSVAGTAPTYTVQWTAIAGATAYILEAGSTPGASDVARVVVSGTSFGPATVAFGSTHYVRVRAVNAAGVGPASQEYVLIAR